MAKSTLLRGSDAIAKALGCHPQTVLKMVHAGELPAFVLAGSLCISKLTLRRWIEQQELQALVTAAEADERMRARMAAEASTPEAIAAREADREERVRRTRAIKLPTEAEIRAKVKARREKAAD